ncbi:MAG: DsbA family protein [Minisyncoccota bacterium]
MQPTFEKFSTPVSIVLAGILIGGAVLWSNAHPGPTRSANPGQPTPAQTADISKVQITGDPFIGNPNAPVTIAYWFDYQCPFCKQNEETAMPQIITDYVNTGKVKIIFKDYQFLGADSQTLGQTAHAVWDIAPDKFYAWHKAVYDNQGTENTGWATAEKIRSITEGVLGASTTDKVLALVKSRGAEYQKGMDADKTEGAGFGVTGTPSFIIGKQLIIGAVPYSQLQGAIETVLKNK